MHSSTTIIVFKWQKNREYMRCLHTNQRKRKTIQTIRWNAQTILLFLLLFMSFLFLCRSFFVVSFAVLFLLSIIIYWNIDYALLLSTFKFSNVLFFILLFEWLWCKYAHTYNRIYVYPKCIDRCAPDSFIAHKKNSHTQFLKSRRCYRKSNVLKWCTKSM